MMNDILVKPSQQIVQDYVVNPTNNLIVKPLDRTVVQPAKDELVLASHKAAQIPNRLVRVVSVDSDNESISKVRNQVMSRNNKTAKKPIGREDFPEHLEKMQSRLRHMVKAAPKEDQEAMAAALASWARSLADDPMGPDDGEFSDSEQVENRVESGAEAIPAA